MVDLETLSTGPDACIIQIGACYFNPETGEIGRTFKMNVDAGSAGNGRIDPQTAYWWLSQSREAIDSVTADPRLPLHPVMTELNQFLQGAQSVWSHATFDFVILMATFRRLGIKPLVSYRSARDIRTLLSLAGKYQTKATRQGTHHDALDDCKFQVAYCVDALNKLVGDVR